MEIFPARASSVCTTFNITDDLIVEENELFEISFSVREDVILACNNSMVTIIDDDSELIVKYNFSGVISIVELKITVIVMDTFILDI